MNTDAISLATSTTGMVAIMLAVIGGPKVGMTLAPLGIVLVLVAVFVYCVHGDLLEGNRVR